MTYDQFLDAKRFKLADAGKSVSRDELHPRMFDHQKDIVQWALRKGRAAVFADTGLGKALDSNTRVVTPSGYKSIRDIHVGDYVIGANGTPTEVVGVFPQGVRSAYRVTFSDGASTVCDPAHLWAVRTKTHAHRKQAWKVMTLRDIMHIGLGGPGTDRQNRWFIPSIEHPAEFPECELPLHPYVLGVLLGDGHIRHGRVSVSSADVDLVDRVSDLLPNGYHAVKNRYSKYDYTLGRSDDRAGCQGGHLTSQLVEVLTELGVYGLLAHEKHIPDCYKLSSVDTRIDILRGLFDTDGSIWTTRGTATVEYSSSSRKLIDDVQFIIQSLGGKCTVKGRKTNCRDNYRITPSFPSGINPFWLPRKSEIYIGPQKYLPRRSIRAIDKVEDCDMTCIKVSADDGLFLIDGFVVTHNTLMELDWARHAADRSILFAPLAVAKQTVREAQKFGIEAQYARSEDEAPKSGIVTANYEMMQHFDPRKYGAVVFDESSILKSYTSKTRDACIEFAQPIPFRLPATATPAPNDFMELGNHAELLGVMSRTEMLSMFFVHDGGSTSQWRLKGHAEEEFFKWLATWAVMIRKPSDFGYSDTLYKLPKLRTHHHMIETDRRSNDSLFTAEALSLSEQQKSKRGSLSARVEALAEIANSSSGEQWMIWCELNDEGDALAKAIDGAVQVSGSDTNDRKEHAILDFIDGKTRVVVSKASIFGFGLNLQNCHNVGFVGVSNSYEQTYQAIRRCWRFGQTNEVHVHMVYADTEAPIVRNVERKGKDADRMANAMIKQMQAVNDIHSTRRDTAVYNPQIGMILPEWIGA